MKLIPSRQVVTPPAVEHAGVVEHLGLGPVVTHDAGDGGVIPVDLPLGPGPVDAVDNDFAAGDDDWGRFVPLAGIEGFICLHQGGDVSGVDPATGIEGKVFLEAGDGDFLDGFCWCSRHYFLLWFVGMGRLGLGGASRLGWVGCSRACRSEWRWLDRE